MNFAISILCVCLLFDIMLKNYCLLATELQWLSLGFPNDKRNITTKDWCKMEALAHKQRKVCKRHTSSMEAIVASTALTLHECQKQLRDRDWNCSVTNTKKIFQPILKSGSRESAFVYALSSAAVAFMITKYCSSGMIEECECDATWNKKAPKNSAFQWSGCSDNIAWGEQFSREFLDVWQTPTKRRITNKNSNIYGRQWYRHNEAKILFKEKNNDVGREEVSSRMKRHCACNGLSGGCEITTCWRSLPEFFEIAAALKKKMDSAVKVKLQRTSGRRFFVNSHSGKTRIVKAEDLVFLRNTKRTCVTKGRHCDPYLIKYGSCDQLCCGRGFKALIKVETFQCRCKFFWCCEVRCENCRKNVSVNICL